MAADRGRRSHGIRWVMSAHLQKPNLELRQRVLSVPRLLSRCRRRSGSENCESFKIDLQPDHQGGASDPSCSHDGNVGARCLGTRGFAGRGGALPFPSHADDAYREDA